MVKLLRGKSCLSLMSTLTSRQVPVVPSVLSAPLDGGQLNRSQAPLCLGFFTYALGLGLLALLNGDSSSGFTIGLLTLAGFGEGFVVQKCVFLLSRRTVLTC